MLQMWKERTHCPRLSWAWAWAWQFILIFRLRKWSATSPSFQTWQCTYSHGLCILIFLPLSLIRFLLIWCVQIIEFSFILAATCCVLLVGPAPAIAFWMLCLVCPAVIWCFGCCAWQHLFNFSCVERFNLTQLHVLRWIWTSGGVHFTLNKVSVPLHNSLIIFVSILHLRGSDMAEAALAHLQSANLLIWDNHKSF